MHLLATVFLLCGEVPEATVSARGAWVLDEKSQPVAPEVWMRGLQLSGLAYADGTLIAVGDQRSNFPAHLLLIAPPNPAEKPDRQRSSIPLAAAPVPIVPDPALGGPILQAYLEKRNPDFEGIACDPYRKDTLYGVIEMDGPFLLEIGWKAGDGKAVIRRIVAVETPGVEPWKADANYRFEGVDVVGPGPDLVLLFERAKDEMPRLLRVTWPPDNRAETIKAEVMPVPFDRIKPRPGKGLLNINGVAVAGRPRPPAAPPDRLLLLIARDHERILVVDLTTNEIVRIVDIDFRGPDGEELKWVSPEGIAIDRKTERVFLVNDPDSVGTNYRRAADEIPRDNYELLVPLLFSIPLADVLPVAGRAAQEARTPDELKKTP